MVYQPEKNNLKQDGGNLDSNNPLKDNKNKFIFPDTTLTTFYEINEETGERICHSGTYEGIGSTIRRAVT